ncbi:hypothetical protein [Flammeovirga pacifica]|uniref:hypothetical protein n=1 Tax=Flammeovirga pacifica TaxID=915059 RepID=UPI001115007F|nr:hypothetical protein [Flammeovirga pacifica]
MKLYYSILISLFISVTNVTYGQVTTNSNLYELVDTDHLNTGLIFKEGNTNYKGTPFFDKEWNVSYVVTKGEIIYDNLMIKFDIFKNEVMFLVTIRHKKRVAKLIATLFHFLYYYTVCAVNASCNATATATDAPTIGLLPIPIKPIIST